MEKLIIVGLSTNARHAYNFVKGYGLFEIIGFAVNEKYKNCDTFYGLPVYALETLKEELFGQDYKIFIALLWNHLNADRKNLYDYCKNEGFTFANLISPHAIIRGNVKGDNCWVHDFVVIQNDACISDDVMIMAYSLIGADTLVESHCFFGARSLLGGGSRIGEQSFVGLNAVILDDTIVGKKCIVGAGTVIKRNMHDYSRCITAANNVITQYEESEIENKLVFTLNVR